MALQPTPEQQKENEEYAEQIRFLIAEFDIGSQARQFLSGDLGKLIAGRSEIEVRAATAELRTVDPTDVKKIRELQNKADQAERALKWLVEAVVRADQAELAVAQMEDNAHG